MSSAITNAGEALIALKQNREEALVIDKFILANMTGVDPAAAVDRTEGKPDAGDIVHEYIIPPEGKGYVNLNQVVYSMLLTSDIGDFDFNWIGLYSSADDTVVAIAYLPTLSKWKTAHPTMGNALTRNFMLEYTGIQDVTQITVDADTWQIDFTARMKGIDERERLSNFDIYGGACFFGNGFQVIDDAGTFKLLPGLGYVDGIRIVQAAAQNLAPGLPAEVFLDVALQPQGSDRVAVVQVVYADPGDYVDGTNDKHYGQKIAEIAADRAITDFRPKTLAGELNGVVAAKIHDHSVADIIDLLNSLHLWEKSQAYVQTPLEIVDGAVVWDMKAAPNAFLKVTADVTSFTITNPQPGTVPTLTQKHDANGPWTCAVPANILWMGGELPEFDTAANAVNRIAFPVFLDGEDVIILGNTGTQYKAV